MKSLFLFLIAALALARANAQKIPINQLISFLGKEEAVMIDYLEKAGWDHPSGSTADSIIEWQYRLGDNEFLELQYYLSKPAGNIYTIDLDLNKTEFLKILNNYAAYGLKKAGIRRKELEIYNDFTKGNARIAVCQSPANGGNHYSLVVYAFGLK